MNASGHGIAWVVLAWAMTCGAVTPAAAQAPWPPPRDPAEVARAESLEIARAASAARPIPAPVTTPTSVAPGRDAPSMFRPSVAASVVGDEGRLAWAPIDSRTGRWVLRGPFVGVTWIANAPREGTLGLGTLIVAGSTFLASLSLVAASGDGLAGLGPMMVGVPLLWLANSHTEWVLAGPRGEPPPRTTALGLYLETRSDLFFPRGEPVFYRAEPGAGLTAAWTLGSGHTLVAHAGLASRADFGAGGATTRGHPRAQGELTLGWPRRR